MNMDFGLAFALFMASIGVWALLKNLYKIFRYAYIEYKRKKVMKVMVTLWRVGLRETMGVRSAKYKNLNLKVHKS